MPPDHPKKVCFMSLSRFEKSPHPHNTPVRDTRIYRPKTKTKKYIKTWTSLFLLTEKLAFVCCTDSEKNASFLSDFFKSLVNFSDVMHIATPTVMYKSRTFNNSRKHYSVSFVLAFLCHYQLIILPIPQTTSNATLAVL